MPDPKHLCTKRYVRSGYNTIDTVLSKTEELHKRAELHIIAMKLMFKMYLAKSVTGLVVLGKENMNKLFPEGTR